MYRETNGDGSDNNEDYDEANPAFLSGGTGRVNGFFSVLVSTETVSNIRNDDLDGLRSLGVLFNVVGLCLNGVDNFILLLDKDAHLNPGVRICLQRERGYAHH